MPNFKVHVVLTRGLEIVQFAPGDALPDWAVDLVGDHCLESEADPVQTFEGEGGATRTDSGDEGNDPDAGDGNDSAADPAVPDFTSPAKPKTRATKDK